MTNDTPVICLYILVVGGIKPSNSKILANFFLSFSLADGLRHNTLYIQKNIIHFENILTNKASAVFDSERVGCSKIFLTSKIFVD